MLYLPDSMAHMSPVFEGQLYANGYATLKELNYYMGMYMRPEYPETWSYNDPDQPELIYKTACMSQEGFYNTSYLIGTKNGPSAGASQDAMETVARFLINTIIHGLLVGGVAGGAFAGQAAHAAGVEAADEAPEFPKRFGTIGYAEASVPRKTLRSYMLGRVCSMAGLKPVSADERASLLAAALLPFRSKKDLLNATEGTAVAEKLMAPLSKIMGVIHSGTFNFSTDLGVNDITWKKIRDDQFITQNIGVKTNSIISQRTSAAEMAKLRDWINDAFHKFRTNVHYYVRQEGPYAFANLFEGRFLPVGDNYGIGIRQMLQNLVDGRRIDGNAIPFFSVEDAKYELDNAHHTIASTNRGIFDIEGSAHRDQRDKWIAAYNRWAASCINQVRRDVALGQHGALAQSFLLPSARLAEEMDAFGAVLETMTEIYQAHGRPVEDYQSFCTALDNQTEVNLAAVSGSVYAWLKQQADNSIQNVNLSNFRDTFVDHFFDMGQDGMLNSVKWLNVPRDSIKTSGKGHIVLTSADTPIPARNIFDDIIAQAFNAGIDTSIEETFRQSGPDFQGTANAMIRELYARSKPQFNGMIPANCCQSILVYPSYLNGSVDGWRIVQALTNAALAVCPNVQIHATGQTESIVFCQAAQHMEVCRLRDVKRWEDEYEHGPYGIKNANSYLHGLSPDVTETDEGWYEEKMPWTDYPSITIPDRDPRMGDPLTGEISREGELMRRLDKLIARACDQGILYSEKTDDGWCIKFVHFGSDVDWKVDITMLPGDPNAAPWLSGRDLVEAVAVQNGKTLADISRTVRLEYAGILSMPASTEELAWQCAARVLRVHVPMYIEVRKSLHQIETWKKDMSANIN